MTRVQGAETPSARPRTKNKSSSLTNEGDLFGFLDLEPVFSCSVKWYSVVAIFSFSILIISISSDA